MKNNLNGVVRHGRKSFALQQTFTKNSAAAIIISTVVLIAIIFSGCQKQDLSKKTDEVQTPSARSSHENALNFYSGLSDQTSWELQQVRAATANYRDIDNAIKDGYADIEVNVEHMGHHFMKTSIVDSVFDMKQPEILVYNRDEKGKQQLVAVEYAIPLSYPRPEGFTGSADVWKDDSGFPFWLLHAWVWAYNPDGVFNWTNPSIELN